MFPRRLRARHRRHRGRRPDDDVATIGCFEPVEDLFVVDLHDLPEVPSLFDEARRDSRALIRFLRGFAEELSRPVERDGAGHVEYVPTQIVTEHLRNVFRDYADHPVDWFVFASAQSQGGRCIVLFADRVGCLEKDDYPRDRGISLRLTDVQLRSRSSSWLAKGVKSVARLLIVGVDASLGPQFRSALSVIDIKDIFRDYDRGSHRDPRVPRGRRDLCGWRRDAPDRVLRSAHGSGPARMSMSSQSCPGSASGRPTRAPSMSTHAASSSPPTATAPAPEPLGQDQLQHPGLPVLDSCRPGGEVGEPLGDPRRDTATWDEGDDKALGSRLILKCSRS